MQAKSCSRCDALESKPARPKKTAGGLGGAGPPPICKHSVFMTGSERVHMGSVFAGRMTLEATLLGLKNVNIIYYDIIKHDLT